MDANRVALVRTKSGGNTRVGSAYLINNSLLVTARHVLREHGKPDKIEVRLRYQDAGWRVAEEEFVVQEEGAPDVAFIKLKEPCLRTPRVVWYTQGLTSSQPWSGAGYVADRGTADEIYLRGYTGLHGTAYRPRDGDARIELTVESGPDEAADWAGISGSPVFIQDRLFACISDARERFNGNRVWAVPLWTLLPARITDLFKADAIQDRAEREITAILDGNAGFRIKLQECLQLEESDGGTIARSLVLDVACKKAFWGVRTAARGRGQRALDPKDRETARRIIEWLLPARRVAFPVGVDDSTRLGHAPTSFLGLYAETAMAAHDGGRAELVVSANGVVGRWALAMPPEPGWTAENIVRHLQQELLDEFPDLFVVSGRKEDLSRDLTGLLGVQQMDRAYGLKVRGPYLVQPVEVTHPEFDVLVRDVQKMPGFWVWRSGPDEDVDSDAAIINSCVRDVLGGQGDTEA